MQYTAFLKRMGLIFASGFLSVLVLLAIAALTPRRWNASPEGDCDYRIYVSGGTMHTNLVVPVQTPTFDWNKHLDLQAIGGNGSEKYQYLQFGWGDRIFYMETPSWERMNISSALRALLLQNPSAMFVKGHTAVPHYPGEELKCIKLSHADYLALMNFIDASFQTNPQGHKLRLGNGQDGASGFYAANGKYSLLKTCNSWTADGLRAANVNTPLWGGLAPAIMRHLPNDCACQQQHH
jgi:uncharacterized protein (TIGR02117 family)